MYKHVSKNNSKNSLASMNDTLGQCFFINISETRIISSTYLLFFFYCTTISCELCPTFPLAILHRLVQIWISTLFGHLVFKVQSYECLQIQKIFLLECEHVNPICYSNECFITRLRQIIINFHYLLRDMGHFQILNFNFLLYFWLTV